jgi:hypothetical protein
LVKTEPSEEEEIQFDHRPSKTDSLKLKHEKQDVSDSAAKRVQPSRPKDDIGFHFEAERVDFSREQRVNDEKFHFAEGRTSYVKEKMKIGGQEDSEEEEIEAKNNDEESKSQEIAKLSVSDDVDGLPEAKVYKGTESDEEEEENIRQFLEKFHINVDAIDGNWEEEDEEYVEAIIKRYENT